MLTPDKILVVDTTDQKLTILGLIEDLSIHFKASPPKTTLKFIRKLTPGGELFSFEAVLVSISKDESYEDTYIFKIQDIIRVCEKS